jgi:hypothetical protein
MDGAGWLPAWPFGVHSPSAKRGERAAAMAGGSLCCVSASTSACCGQQSRVGAMQPFAGRDNVLTHRVSDSTTEHSWGPGFEKQPDCLCRCLVNRQKEREKRGIAGGGAICYFFLAYAVGRCIPISRPSCYVSVRHHDLSRRPNAYAHTTSHPRIVGCLLRHLLQRRRHGAV